MEAVGRLGKRGYSGVVRMNSAWHGLQKKKKGGGKVEHQE